MSDERDEKDDPAEELKQGIGHLWRAARGMTRQLKKEANRTSFGRVLDDASREFARAATNVVERITTEIGAKRPDPSRHDEPPEWVAPPNDHDEDDEFDGVRPVNSGGPPRERGSAPEPPPKDKPKCPTPEDPGFRIAVDDDEKKER